MMSWCALNGGNRPALGVVGEEDYLDTQGEERLVEEGVLQDGLHNSNIIIIFTFPSTTDPLLHPSPLTLFFTLHH